MKKFIFIFFSLLILLGIPVLGITVANNPTTIAAKAIQELVTDVQEREEIELLKEIFNEGSISGSLTKVEDNGKNVFQNSKISGKIYFNKNELYLSNINIKAEELNISGDLYISENELFIKEDNYIKGKYGINFNTIKKDLDNSIFAPTSDSDFALDRYTYNDIIESVDLLNKYKDVRKDLTKDLEELTKKLGKDIWKIASKTFEFKLENEKVLINDEETKAKVITITIDGNSFANFVEQFVSYLKETDLIVNFLTKYEKTLKNLDIISISDESLVEQYQNFIDNISLEEELEEIKENLETINIKLYTSKFSSHLSKLEFIVSDEEEQETLFTLEIGKKGIKKTNQIRFTFDETQYKYSIDKDKKGNTKVILESKRYFENSTLTTSRITINSFELNINKKEKTYELKIVDTMDESKNGELTKYTHDIYTVKGTCDKTGNTLNLSIDTIENLYEREYGNGYSKPVKSTENIEMDLNITIQANDPMPKFSKDYKSIDNITEDDIYNWVESLEDDAY